MNIPAFALVVIAAAIWVFVQGEFYVMGNISWLTMSAQRIMEGKDILGHAYDNNPPLSILIYMPAVLLSDVLHLPIYRAIFLFTSLMIVLACFVTWIILKRIETLSHSEKIITITAFFLSVTIATGIFLSEREHYIAIWLLPFVLCQYCIIEKIKLPALLQIIAMTLGAITILIKPNFGIVPVAMIAMRMIQNRVFFSILKDRDFLILSAATLGYLWIVIAFFPGYAFVIFPDALALYFGSPAPFEQIYDNAILPLSFFAGAALVEALFSSKRLKSQRSFMFILYLCAGFALTGYITQGKGFEYHLIPTYVFLIPAAGLTAFHVCRLIQPSAHKLHSTLPFLFILILALSFIHWNHIPSPTHDKIEDAPLSLYLEENCTAPCSFYAFHHTVEMVNPTALYMTYDHASRFSTAWFLPNVIKMDFTGNKEQAHIMKQRFTSYIVEDIEYYKPSILLIAKDLPIEHYGPFDFMKYFGSDKNFRTLIEENYKKEPDTLTIDFSHYYTLAPYSLKQAEYDIYKKVK